MGVSMAGTFCVSIDLELGWGIWDKPEEEYFERCAARERDIVRRMVALLDEHEISATWAIVARLLERDDARSRSTSHGESIWYAPDVVEVVRNARIPQDIGSHSYAHPYFGETDRATLQADLAAARRVHDRHGLPFASFVFPRNQVANEDLLVDAGVRVFRSVYEGWHVSVRERFGRQAGRVAHLASNFVPTAPPIVEPRPAHGLTELPSSMLFLGRKGVRRFVAPPLTILKARRGMRAAASSGGCFHLWCHPSNFYHRTDEQLETFGRVLGEAARMRNAGELATRAMRDFERAA